MNRDFGLTNIAKVKRSGFPFGICFGQGWGWFMFDHNKNLMNNSGPEALDPEEELRASNEVMKLKLQVEHGMRIQESTELNPVVESQWLNYIYNYEKVCKDSSQLTVHEFVGSPLFLKSESLRDEEVQDELDRLLAIMENNSVQLNCLCSYEPRIMYRFITEEFFLHKMDAIRMDGMTHQFIYEEFHPNDDYDLRHDTDRLIKSLFSEKWNPQWHNIMLCDRVRFKDFEYPRTALSDIILEFQEAHESLELGEHSITSVKIEDDKCHATVELNIAYCAHACNGKPTLIHGKASIHFAHEMEWWFVSGFAFPGFGVPS
jgi:hypothetical protein